MLEAMESAIAPVLGADLAEAREKEGAMAGSTAVYELRVYHGVSGKVGESGGALPGQYDEDFYERSIQECGVLDTTEWRTERSYRPWQDKSMPT
jgi:hypothetical protein